MGQQAQVSFATSGLVITMGRLCCKKKQNRFCEGAETYLSYHLQENKLLFVMV